MCRERTREGIMGNRKREREGENILKYRRECAEARAHFGLYIVYDPGSLPP